MNPTIAKRPVVLDGHEISLTLEDEFWSALKVIAKSRGETVEELIARLDAERTMNLSSALRVFVLQFYRDRYSLSLGSVASLAPSGGSEVLADF